MSKRQFKTQASSSRAVSGKPFGGFGTTSNRSTLSYVAELPDLSSITDPNVVVAFKSLSKADGTTKIKALETIDDYISQHPNEDGGGVEDPILEAWVKFYPRLSVNNHRRVREQAHNHQVKLLQSARKRMERHLPDTVASWLSGCYDRDGFVARAAQNGVASFLDTDNKVTAFWTRCQDRILEYANEAIDETPETLSDERNTSTEDAQILYLRVICSSISLVTNLLINLRKDDILKFQDQYERFLNHKKLWEFASSDDAFVRRQLYNLLVTCLEKQPEVVKSSLEMISRGFIAKGLSSSQTTSSLQLLDALRKLTVRFPDVWTTSYKGRAAPINKIRDFIKKGSQGAPVEYWPSFLAMLSALPDGVLPMDKEGCLQFLTEFRNAIQGREQPRQHAGPAWKSYFGTIRLLLRTNSDAEFQSSLFRDALCPTFDKYIQGEPERIPVTTDALAGAYSIWASNDAIKPQDRPSLHTQKLANAFIARSLSTAHIQPDDTEEYKQGQKKVIAEGHRWFSLLAEIIQVDRTGVFPKSMLSSCEGILSSAIKTVVSTEGQSYSAAAIIEIALRLTPSVISNSAAMLDSVSSLIETYLPQPSFISSPSLRYLISSLYIIKSFDAWSGSYEKAWLSTVKELCTTLEQSRAWAPLQVILANASVANLAQSTQELQEVLLAASVEGLEGDSSANALFETAVLSDCYAASSSEQLLQQIMRQLSQRDHGAEHNQLDTLSPERGFSALEFVLRHRPALLRQSKENQMQMTAIFLEFTELSNKSLATRASTLKRAIESSSQQTEEDNYDSTLDLMRWNLELELTNERILRIETLVQQAEAFKVKHEGSFPAATFFPDPEKWYASLSSALTKSPNPALGVIRPFNGPVLLDVLRSVGQPPQTSLDITRFAVSLRMALYTSQFVDDVGLLSRVPLDALLSLLHSLLLTAEIVSDELDLLAPGEIPEWAVDVVEDEIDELRLLASGCHLTALLNDAKGWESDESITAGNPGLTSSRIVSGLVNKLLQHTDNSPGQYYAAKALSHLVTNLIGIHGWDLVRGEAWLSSLGLFSSSSTNTFGMAAILIGLETNASSSKLINNYCNRLVSDVAGASATSEKTFSLLVKLNAVLSVYQEDEIPVASNRLIFAVKQILSWTPDLATKNRYQTSESCRALQVLLPSIKDVYGTYWESSLSLCTSIWESSSNGDLSEEDIPMIGMSLKLYSILRKLEDANDDLQEALAEQSQVMFTALVNLLKLRRQKEHQPLDFVDTLLLRELRDIPAEMVENADELYALLASENRNLQSAAYDLLHRALPQSQQQKSVDVLLEGKVARLPDELLSLLLDPPSIDNFFDEQLEDFPLPIRGYLLSWHLVYESYASASLKVRNDYSDLLKSENYIGPLLGLLFDLLSTYTGASGDLSRFESSMISNYEIWTAIDSESPKRDMSWLLVNLYYMCLKYTPNLTRNWWLDCKSKQTKIAASKWTDKVFSPILIQEVKDEVSKWAAEQDTSDDKKELIIKTSKNSPEIHAGYEIDDMMMQIVVSLPQDYPLQGVEVRGVNRVAVNEKTWRAWQVIAQGVMRLNTIVDGLILFRDNVAAAMSGKTECAICYSIIAQDKRMPDKRCGTCKNLFHAGCLFKWFQSSNQSTCPLCRNPFTYGGDGGRRRGEE